MSFSPGFKRAYWLALVAILTWFLWLRVGDAVAGNATGADALVFAVWIGLLLAPLYSEVELLGVTLKQAVDEAKKEIKSEVVSLRSEVANAIAVSAQVNQTFHLTGLAGSIPESRVGQHQRSPMEYKILNTLWTKQVLKYPDMSQRFTFRIHATSPEFLQFREAGNRLLGEGHIGETDSGQFYLTDQGLEFCKANYRDFPAAQWWPEEQFDDQNLKMVLNTV